MTDSKNFNSFRERMRDSLIKRFGSENICPFWGNQDAKIVHISQAPSLSVIKNRKPFADKSGEKLRSEWYQVSERVFYNPDNFYFTAVGMYFPGKNKNGGDNKPSLKIAEKWLKEELSYLSPKLYLILGGLAADFFFPGQKLANLVLSDQKINGVRAFVLPHPSPLNIKWFKDNPAFEEKRLTDIRNSVRQIVGI